MQSPVLWFLAPAMLFSAGSLALADTPAPALPPPLPAPAVVGAAPAERASPPAAAAPAAAVGDQQHDHDHDHDHDDTPEHGADLEARPRPAAGEAPASAAAARAGFPFAGRVLGDRVNLRAGPSTSHEAVLALGQDERVTILAEAFGWYVAQPAREVSVFVHQDLLSSHASGMGIIARDRVNLRAGPSTSASVVGQAQRGDLVRVLGAEPDGWVRLQAPPQATFYIHRDYVRRAGALESGTESGDPALAVAEAAAESAASSAPRTRTRDATDLLIEARDLYLAELDKVDMLQMRFDAALARYEEARARAERDSVRAAAEGGIRQVRLAIKLREDYAERVRRLEELGAAGGDAAGAPGR